MLKFRIWHAFLVVAVLAAACYVALEDGYGQARIQILDFDTLPVPGSRPPRFEVSRIRYRDLSQTGEIQKETLMFLVPGFTTTEPPQPGEIVKLRFRKRSLLRLPTQTLEQAWWDRLGLDESWVDSKIEQLVVVNSWDLEAP